jgi:hypothetical protein
MTPKKQIEPKPVSRSRGRPKSNDLKMTRPLRVGSRWEAWQAAVAASPYASVNELIEESVERELRRLKSDHARKP